MSPLRYWYFNHSTNGLAIVYRYYAEELKTKLSKAAMLKSQRILTEVLDAQTKA